jgi:hypothetical protein
MGAFSRLIQFAERSAGLMEKRSNTPSLQHTIAPANWVFYFFLTPKLDIKRSYYVTLQGVYFELVSSRSSGCHHGYQRSGPLETAQRLFPNRPYHSHNAAITVVRTKQKEIAVLGKKIADLCNAARGKYQMMVPMEGFSAFDHPSGPLHDPEAPEIFLKSLRGSLDSCDNLNVLPFHINDPEFAQELIKAIERFLFNS